MDFTTTTCNPGDDWGCVDDDELFFSAGPTPSFRSLIESFEATTTTRHTEELLISNVTEGGMARVDDDKRVEEVVKDEKLEEPDKHSPVGILKKAAVTNPDQKGLLNLKRVTFEIERFVAANIEGRNERLSAEQQLVMKLGAKAPKRKALNYKRLKEQRLEERANALKTSAEQDTLDKLLLKGTGGGKVVKRKKFKMKRRNNKSGVVKKRSKQKHGDGKRRK